MVFISLSISHPQNKARRRQIYFFLILVIILAVLLYALFS